MAIKKSKFVGSSVVGEDATFDFVIGGTNLKITKADLIAALGMTGSLSQVGDQTATPVLDISGGADKGIRNLQNGSGVKASISPQNGITLEHNFTFNAAGAPLTPDSTALSPVMRSLVAGPGISIGASGNIIQIATSVSPVSTKTVVINEASDFPPPSGGVITLADDTDYFITNDITLPDRFEFGDNTQLRGAGTVIITLTYTGTGAMISCEDCNIRAIAITLQFPNGSLFDVTSSTAAGIGVVAFQSVVLIGDDLGSANCRIFSIFLSAVVVVTKGIAFTASTMDVISIDSCTWIQFGGTGLALAVMVSESIQVKNVFLTISSGVIFIDGLTNSGNISSTGSGIVTDVRGTGAGVELGANIVPDDSRWGFGANTRIRNTIRDAIVSVQGNATETVIASEATPVKAAATFTVGRSSGFTGDTTGRVTYDLLNGIVMPMTATLTVLKASGGASRVKAYIAVNGSIVADSGIGADCSAAESGNITLTWQSELAATNFIEVFLENPAGEGTVNNILVDAVLRVN